MGAYGTVYDGLGSFLSNWSICDYSCKPAPPDIPDYYQEILDYINGDDEEDYYEGFS